MAHSRAASVLYLLEPVEWLILELLVFYTCWSHWDGKVKFSIEDDTCRIIKRLCPYMAELIRGELGGGGEIICGTYFGMLVNPVLCMLQHHSYLDYGIVKQKLMLHLFPSCTATRSAWFGMDG